MRNTQNTFDIYFNFPRYAGQDLFLEVPDHLNRTKGGVRIGDPRLSLRDSFLEKSYINALLDELALKAKNPLWQGRVVRSVYLRNGSSPQISSQGLKTVINTVKEAFPIASDAAITLETSPVTNCAAYLTNIYRSGISHLVLQTWSFLPATLATLGCTHTAEQAQYAFHTAREVGFRSVGIDLVYAVPQQTITQFRYDLETTLILRPDHIGAYPLHVHRGTQLFKNYKKRWWRAGRKLVPYPVRERMAAVLQQVLNFAGYENYQIYALALPGKQPLYRTSDWLERDLLRLGAAAE